MVDQKDTIVCIAQYGGVRIVPQNHLYAVALLPFFFLVLFEGTHVSVLLLPCFLLSLLELMMVQVELLACSSQIGNIIEDRHNRVLARARIWHPARDNFEEQFTAFDGID